VRILLATDGSGTADRACDLVAATAWPQPVEIRVIGAIEHGPALFGSPWIPAIPPDAADIEDEAVGHMRDVLGRAAAAVAGPGRTVDVDLLRGSPARAVVDEMHEWVPDLVVVGSRGHSPVETTLVGSTSSAIVDHATCPVLVVRRGPSGTVVFAEDGSPAARDAETLLCAWPLFRGELVDVVSVVDIAAPWRTGIAPTMFGNAMDVYGDMITSAGEVHERLAVTTTARLRAAGLRVEMQLREGDPVTEIVGAAREDGAALIVVGSRGHTGLARAVLGGVAHGVLTHAPCSVLIVRHRST